MATANPILISGAGIGGLLLARALTNQKIPFLLYERDASIDSRAQGYRLRISGDGINALSEVLSTEEYARLEDGTAQTAQGGFHNVDAISGEETSYDESGGGGSSGGPKLGKGVLGISRAFLRERLFEGEENVVHWRKQAVGYTLTASGVVLNFADGTSSPEGSMLVAADGPHSRITKQLTDGKVRAYDTGARMIHGQTAAKAYNQLGNGVWSVTDESRAEGTIGLITNMRPGIGDDVELGWNLVGGPGTFSAPGENYSIVGQVAADLSRELTAKWHPRVRAIFDQQNDAEAAFLKMSTAHPDGVPEWTNSPRVTIMGDAAHTMTPAGGVGANTAMRDAALIAKLLKEAGGWHEDITQKYEQEMRVYASAAVKMSFEAASGRFGFDVTTIK